MGIQKMKIGIDISQLVYKTGVSRYIKELVLNLVKIDRKNHYVLFGSSLRRQGELNDFLNLLGNRERVESKFYPLPPTLLDLLWNRLHKINIENFSGKIDLFHTSDWTEPPSGAKKITTIHDLAIFKYPQDFNPKIVSVHKRKMGWAKKESSKIIAVSQNTRKDIQEIMEIPEEKIAVIYEGAGSAFEPKSAGEIQKTKKKFGIKREYLLTVVTKGARKNLTRLIEAYQKIKTGDIELVVVGSFNQNDRRIKFIDFIADENDLASLYCGAYAFLFPSLYEGFGLPVLEAMACSTPVVISSTSSLPEVGGEAAIYVDPENPESIVEGIEKVLNLSKEEYREMKIKVIGQAKKFSWEDSARETLKTYEEVFQS